MNFEFRRLFVQVLVYRMNKCCGLCFNVEWVNEKISKLIVCLQMRFNTVDGREGMDVFAVDGVCDCDRHDIPMINVLSLDVKMCCPYNK